MIGDLYERKHFNNSESALWLLESFVDGYGAMSDDMAFRTAIHAGVQLICCYTRRAPTDPLPGTPEQVADAMKLGVDIIVKAWKKDKAWLETSILSCMFKRP